MRNLKNTKEEFTAGVVERLRDGRWGMEEVEYLNENRQKYNLNYEDIGFFLIETYKYTYAMAMEDGIITPVEQAELNIINQLFMEQMPKRRGERELLKAKIFTLTRRFEKTNGMQEQMDMEQAYVLSQEQKLEHDAEMKKKVSSIYYRLPTPYPKLTPYNY